VPCGHRASGGGLAGGHQGACMHARGVHVHACCMHGKHGHDCIACQRACTVDRHASAKQDQRLRAADGLDPLNLW
jgi:hypothetical protein